MARHTTILTLRILSDLPPDEASETLLEQLDDYPGEVYVERVASDKEDSP